MSKVVVTIVDIGYMSVNIKLFYSLGIVDYMKDGNVEKIKGK